MKFQFDSLQDFLAMGDHGFYVWLCYGVSFVVLFLLAMAPTIGKKRIIAKLKRIQLLNQSRNS
ncbi:hypothetical protein NBRC116493_34140 [Aurantivibrio infirmus]